MGFEIVIFEECVVEKYEKIWVYMQNNFLCGYEVENELEKKRVLI